MSDMDEPKQGPGLATAIARLGLGIKSARENRGMSQEALAARSGVSRVTLAKYEDGQVTKLAELSRIYNALGLSLTVKQVGEDDYAPPSESTDPAQVKALRVGERANDDLERAVAQERDKQQREWSEVERKLRARLIQLATHGALTEERYHLLVESGFSSEGVTLLWLVEQLDPDKRFGDAKVDLNLLFAKKNSPSAEKKS
jgi:transcriptional regulator with XRE-family HTH domain